MKRNLIRYRTHTDRADENQRLIEAVFAELAATRPEGVRYVALRLPDDSFYHLVFSDSDAGLSSLTKLAAFQAFQTGSRDRCAEPPHASEVTVVGSYRMVER